METLHLQLHRVQSEFVHDPRRIRGFVAGRGAGKSWIGTYHVCRQAKPRRLYGIYGPTYRHLMDTTLRTFKEVASQLRFLKSFSASTLSATLGNGAEVLFRSLETPDRARGPNLSGAYIDEASLIDLEAYRIILASLRQGGEQGWCIATFTPKGKDHWTYPTFTSGDPQVALYHCSTRANPFNPPSFYLSLRAQYPSEFAAQELEGEFVAFSGGLVKREWFSVVESMPAGATCVRAWDLAATEAKTNADDPDYIVGTRLGVSQGQWYVDHVIRQRVGPAGVKALILQTAQVDGKTVPILLEQEPGASGKIVAQDYIRALAGWNIRAVPSQGDKVTRAMPFLAQAEARNVYLVRGAWNENWLDEWVSFPKGGHDDQVDSTSLAFSGLVTPTAVQYAESFYR